MKIAFFDSGIGGLSVLHHAMRVLPNEQFVFYADEDNVPYGVKTTDEVKGFVQQAFDFLVDGGVLFNIGSGPRDAPPLRHPNHRHGAGR